MVKERFNEEIGPVKEVMHPHPRHWLARRLTGLGVILLLTLTGAGCATSNAPDGFLPTVPEMLTDPFGAWVEVDTSEAGPVLVGGELLAVDDDSLYVLPEGSIRVRGISRDEIRHVRLMWFDSKWGHHSIWTLLGSLSTASHGGGLVFSLPVWTLTGIGISAERSRDPIVTYPGVAWSELSKYARYPQGIPNGVDLLLPRGNR